MKNTFITNVFFLMSPMTWIFANTAFGLDSFLIWMVMNIDITEEYRQSEEGHTIL